MRNRVGFGGTTWCVRNHTPIRLLEGKNRLNLDKTHPSPLERGCLLMINLGKLQKTLQNIQA